MIEINNKKVDNLIEEEIKHNNVEKINKENSYLGILSIPKINLKKEFYNINDSRNDVNQNIMLLKESTMPDTLGGTIILAAHSGNSYLGYFHDLDKLIINDEIDIYYQNNKYTYIVSKIYEEDKDGDISFNKNISENYLVLTTCSKNSNKQLVILAKKY